MTKAAGPFTIRLLTFGCFETSSFAGAKTAGFKQSEVSQGKQDSGAGSSAGLMVAAIGSLFANVYQ
ncbi:MAG TPA: hypothetical protein PKE45_10740 [Caldilineaceae bacterium]|nr:hypothetical protein [Caldilineaceae bacterium]